MKDGPVAQLQFVQTAVERMAANSFLLKGWNVTIASAILAFAAKDARAEMVPVILLPAFAFWGLDAYYLRQERLFRCLFEDLCRSAQSAGGDSPAIPFSLSTARFRREVPGWFSTLWAPTIVALHGAVVVTSLIAAGLLRDP